MVLTLIDARKKKSNVLVHERLFMYECLWFVLSQRSYLTEENLILLLKGQRQHHFFQTHKLSIYKNTPFFFFFFQF